MARRTAVLWGGVAAGVVAVGSVGGFVIAGAGHGRSPHGLAATHFEVPARSRASRGGASPSSAPVVGAAAGGSVVSPETAAARGGASTAASGATGAAGLSAGSGPSTDSTGASGSSTGASGSSSGVVSSSSSAATHASSTGSTPSSSNPPVSQGTSSGADASSGAPGGSGDGGGDHAAPVTVSDPDGPQVPADGSPVVFTATLTPPPGLPDPTGSVTFTVAEPGSGAQRTACTVAVHQASATCAVSFPTPGRYDVAAFYVPGTGSGGRSTYVPSQGAIAVTAVAGASA